MPAPAMVNPVKTPMAYTATREVTSESVTTSRAMATTARTMIPLEKVSRWPRW